MSRVEAPHLPCPVEQEKQKEKVVDLCALLATVDDTAMRAELAQRFSTGSESVRKVRTERTLRIIKKVPWHDSRSSSCQNISKMTDILELERLYYETSKLTLLGWGKEIYSSVYFTAFADNSLPYPTQAVSTIRDCSNNLRWVLKLRWSICRFHKDGGVLNYVRTGVNLKRAKMNAKIDAMMKHYFPRDDVTPDVIPDDIPYDNWEKHIVSKVELFLPE
tara:strand:- start:4003 stop:4659 length:657 start_codon:yes stop_codon:yes gene_type:complete